MKNRFMYSIVLVLAVSQGVVAQELSQTQDSAAPQPYETLPAVIMADDITVPAVPEVPVLPAPPVASEFSSFEQDSDEMDSMQTEALSQEQESEPKLEIILPAPSSASEQVQDSSQTEVFEADVAPMKEESLQEKTKEEMIPKEQSQKVAVNIGLDEDKRKEVVNALNVLLADEYLLYTKTFKYHWNVQGKHFGALHEFFQKQYEALQGFSDGVAERIRMLGFMPPATFAEFTQLATLREQPGHNPDDLGMIADLLKDHEQIIRNMRGYIDLTAKLNDMGTNNFLADLIEKHEKMAWMLRAHLER